MSEMSILYIDDEEDLVNIANSFFEYEGLPIDSSTSFEDALQKIRSKKYDIIISDSRMPTGTGRDLVQQIRKEGSFHGKFLLITGNIDLRFEEDILIYDKVLYKPIKFTELIELVKSLLSVEL